MLFYDWQIPLGRLFLIQRTLLDDWNEVHRIDKPIWFMELILKKIIYNIQELQEWSMLMMIIGMMLNGDDDDANNNWDDVRSDVLDLL